MIIGEIGVNHNGNVAYAKKLISELIKTKVVATQQTGKPPAKWCAKKKNCLAK